MSSRRLKRDIPAFRGQESVRLDESKLDLWSVIGWPRSPHRSTAKKLGPQNFDFSRNFLQITHSKLSPLPSLIRRPPPPFSCLTSTSPHLSPPFVTQTTKSVPCSTTLCLSLSTNLLPFPLIISTVSPTLYPFYFRASFVTSFAF